VGLVDERKAVVLEPVHEPDLPQRLGAVQALGEDPAREQAQLLEASRLGQGRDADVVIEVEPWIVDPQGTPQLQPRERELLAVAGDEV